MQCASSPHCVHLFFASLPQWHPPSKTQQAQDLPAVVLFAAAAAAVSQGQAHPVDDTVHMSSWPVHTQVTANNKQVAPRRRTILHAAKQNVQQKTYSHWVQNTSRVEYTPYWECWKRLDVLNVFQNKRHVFRYKNA